MKGISIQIHTILSVIRTGFRPVRLIPVPARNDRRRP